MTIKKIGTHNGRFHCDEILAVAMLRQLPEYRDAELVRTRDPTLLNECDIVVDVGAEYDPIRLRFDHHQPSFNRTMKSFHPDLTPDVKLSSAGLVYARFGKRVIGEIIGQPYNTDENRDIAILFGQIYTNFVSEVDAIDNGVTISPAPPTYAIHTGLSCRVQFFNPSWNNPDADETECFNNAYKMVEKEFVSRVCGLAENWLPARSIVRESLSSRYSVHASGLIMRITAPSCPWKAHFFDLEKQLIKDENDPNYKGRPVFILLERKGEVSVCAIPCSEDAPFSKRVPLPLAWAGKRGEELSEAVGVTDCIFVHSSCFLGIHKTYDGALEMAVRALKANGCL